eukprot:scaffold17531_cov241-Isochrysis_galbana.AAC.9
MEGSACSHAPPWVDSFGGARTPTAPGTAHRGAPAKEQKPPVHPRTDWHRTGCRKRRRRGRGFRCCSRIPRPG